MTSHVSAGDAVPTFELYGESGGRAGDFCLHCETIPARSHLHSWEIGIHQHAVFLQILLVEQGSGVVMLGSETLELRPPLFIVVPRGLRHGFRFSPDVDGLVVTVAPGRLCGVWPELARLGAFLSTPHLLPVEAGNEDAQFAADALRRLSREFERTAAGRAELMQASLVCTLLLLHRLSRGQEAPPNRNQQRVERFASLLRRHLREHKPATFYADQLGISTTHLNRILRATTGEGTQSMIARALLEEAKRELMFATGTVQDIALRLGFLDPAYFSRFFTHHAGLTPRAWREREHASMRAWN